MKFTLLVLIGICALAVQGSELNEIENDLFLLNEVKTVQDIIDAIIEFARNAVNAIVNKAEEIAKKLRDTVKKLVNQAKKELEKVREKIEKILEEIAKQNEHARQCVEVQRPRVQEIVQAVNQGLENCALNASQQVQDLQQQVQVHVEAVQTQIVILRGLVKECLEQRAPRPISVVSCILGQAQEIRESIVEAINEGRQAVELASETLPEIGKSLQKCTVAVVTDAALELQQVVADVRDCIAEGQQKNNLLN